MREIQRYLDALFPIHHQDSARASVGGVLIWHGQRTVEHYFYGPGDEALSLEDYIVRHYRESIEPRSRSARPLRVIRYGFDQGYRFECNCDDLFDRVGLLRPREPEAQSADQSSSLPGLDLGELARPRTDSVPQDHAREDPELALQILQAMVRTAEADVANQHRQNALYLFQIFGILFLLNADREETLLQLRGFLNSLPERLYDLGHLLVFLAPTAEQAQVLKAELFADSPFVHLIPAPEPDEASIFDRVMSEQFQGEPNPDVIACADLSAAWLKRNSSGRNKLFRFLYDQVSDRSLDRAFLEAHAVQDVEDLFLNLDLEELDQRLKARVFNQDHVIDELVRGLLDVKRQIEFCRERGRQRRPGPLYRALLAGPSGTGKSHLARTLAQELFGTTPHEILMENITNRTSLVGAPAGHVGFGQIHSALQSLLDSGSGVVLIDEWERAGSDGVSRKAIHDAFMSVFEEGQLDTEDRRQVSFHDAVVLVTTNLGMYAVDYDQHQELRRYDSVEQRQAAYKKAITDPTASNFIEYPWLGRLGGEPLVFQPFQAEHMVALAEIEWAAQLASYLDRPHPPAIEIVDGALRDLYRRCWDPRSGARVVRLRIQRQLSDLMAERQQLVRLEREETVRLGWRGGKVEVVM